MRVRTNMYHDWGMHRYPVCQSCTLQPIGTLLSACLRPPWVGRLAPRFSSGGDLFLDYLRAVFGDIRCNTTSCLPQPAAPVLQRWSISSFTTWLNGYTPMHSTTMDARVAGSARPVSGRCVYRNSRCSAAQHPRSSGTSTLPPQHGYAQAPCGQLGVQHPLAHWVDCTAWPPKPAGSAPSNSHYNSIIHYVHSLKPPRSDIDWSNIGFSIQHAGQVRGFPLDHHHRQLSITEHVCG